MTEIASIFNDALAPVTPGPSSGCTGAPVKIAHIGCSLLKKPPVKMCVEIASNSRYVENLYSMRSDLSFISGVLGRDSTHPRFLNAYEDAKAAGIEVEFVTTEEVLPYQQEVCRLYLYSADGEVISLYSDSIGGGLFLISDVDGCPVNIDGSCYETLLFCEKMPAEEQRKLIEDAKNIYTEYNEVSYDEGEFFGILEIKSGDKLSSDALEMLKKLKGVKDIRTIKPEHPVARSRYRKPPFETSTEMIAYAEKTGYSLWQLAVEYEKALSGWTDEQVMDYAAYLLSVTEKSAARGLEGKGDMHGYVPNRTAQIQKKFESDNRIPMGAVDKGAPYALGIMEDSNASGTIVCIPTGGSSGIVPGAIYGVGKTMGKSRDEMIKALLVAGLMGVFMYKTRYNGNIGCQAEVGCATGMAAGALVYLAGGDVKTACDAATMGLQCLTGLVCDAVCATVQTPCFIRNMSGTAIAMVCANAAMGGLDALMPIEEIAEAMTVLGERMVENNCNYHGACDTPTAKKLEEEQKKRNTNLRSCNCNKSVECALDY